MKKIALSLIVLTFCFLPSYGGAEVLFEGFESGTIPPPGWTRVINNMSQTWQISTNSPHSGTYRADIFYDQNLALQNEWLVSPQITPASGFTVSAWSLGSTYWGKSPYDNYDLKLWLVYGDVGGSDDVLVGKLDDAWMSDWIWAKSDFDLAGLYAPGAPVRVGFQYYGVDGAEAALDDISIQYEPVPEPATMLLLASGLAGLAGLKRKYFKF